MLQNDCFEQNENYLTSDDCNRIRTHKHLGGKQTLNYLHGIHEFMIFEIFGKCYSYYSLILLCYSKLYLNFNFQY